MTRSSSRLRLRTRIVLLVLLGGILPLAVWGWWILRTTERTGEELLRGRLDDSLAEVARSIGLEWVGVRSVLVDLSEAPAVQAALSGNPPDATRPSELMSSWGVLEGAVDRVVLRDGSGQEVFALDRPVTGPGPRFSLPPVRIPVRRPLAAAVVGELRVSLSASTLLPGNALVPGVSGSVLAVLDRDGVESNLPLAMDASLLRRDRFTWGGQEWVAARHELSEPAYTLAMAGPLTPFTRPLETARERALTGLLLAVGVGVGLGLLFSGRMAGSLERLARAADRVSSGAFDVEIAPEGPDEVARLGHAFNHMTRSLRETMERAARQETLAEVGRFAASLAHEIRNPLTSARLDLERAEEGMSDDPRERRLVRRALSELVRLDGSVSGALRLARSGRVEKEDVDVRAPLGEALEAARPIFEGRGAALDPVDPRARWPHPVHVRADRAALQRVAFNLLQNAAMAVREGGRAEVHLTVEGSDVVIEVRDDGRGMTPEELSRATDLLYTTRAEGTGLGLPIARRIVEAHGGRLELSSRSGGGTVARVRIPRAPTDVDATRPGRADGDPGTK